MWHRILLFSIVLMLGVAAPGRADFVIAVDSGTVTAGGTSSVDVFITPTAGDSLVDFAVKFQITQLTASSILPFTTPQPSPGFADSRYVFFGNSADQQNSPPLPLFPTVKTTNTLNDTILGGDSIADSSAVTLSGSKLLATLQFNAPQGAAVGDTFQIALIADNNTVFDSGPAENPTPAFFTSTPGTITVVSPTLATPVPGSLALLLTGAGSLLGWGWVRRSRHAARGKA